MRRDLHCRGRRDLQGVRLKPIYRADDQPMVSRRRLQVYRNQTEPLIAYYTNKGILKVVQASGTVDGVFVRVAEILDSLNK